MGAVNVSLKFSRTYVSAQNQGLEKQGYQDLENVLDHPQGKGHVMKDRTPRLIPTKSCNKKWSTNVALLNFRLTQTENHMTKVLRLTDSLADHEAQADNTDNDERTASGIVRSVIFDRPYMAMVPCTATDILSRQLFSR